MRASFPADPGARYKKQMQLAADKQDAGPSTVAEASRQRGFYLETYGCQMNLADSELIQSVLEKAGYRPVADPLDAGVVLLNTCAIREHAEQRVAQRVRALISASRNSRVRIGLAGCMAQHHREKLLAAIPGLDFVVGPDGYRGLGELLNAEGGFAQLRLDRDETYADISPVRGAGTRAWLTIMRGCNRFCTFCVVPYVRGRERSLPAPVLLNELRSIAEQGYKEVVLLGQTVNAYEHDGVDFAALLRMASSVDGIERVRFTSPHPADMSTRDIEAMADCDKVMPQLHLPLQSGSDRVLKAMDRGHDMEQYRRLVEQVRAAVPDIALSTDIIVGFPGESESDFEATSAVMDEVGFDHAYMFKYSRRERTRAEDIEETVSEEEKSARLSRLIDEQQERAGTINKRMLGQLTQVLADSPAKKQAGWLAGKNPQYKTVVFDPHGAAVGDLVDVKIEATGPHTLRGQRVA